MRLGIVVVSGLAIVAALALFAWPPSRRPPDIGALPAVSGFLPRSA